MYMMEKTPRKALIPDNCLVIEHLASMVGKTEIFSAHRSDYGNIS